MQSFQRLRRYGFWLGLSCVLLAGCQSASYQDFSMREEDWAALTPDAKASLLKQYQSAHRPTMTTLTGMTHHATHYPTIEVTLKKGSALMWPKHQRRRVQPQQFVLKVGACQTKAITDQQGDAQTELQVCYDGQAVWIDPSRWRKAHVHGSLIVHENMMWAHGMTYPPLDSQGYAQLQQAVFAIRQVA